MSWRSPTTGSVSRLRKPNHGGPVVWNEEDDRTLLRGVPPELGTEIEHLSVRTDVHVEVDGVPPGVGCEQRSPGLEGQPPPEAGDELGQPPYEAGRGANGSFEGEPGVRGEG